MSSACPLFQRVIVVIHLHFAVESICGDGARVFWSFAETLIQVFRTATFVRKLICFGKVTGPVDSFLHQEGRPFDWWSLLVETTLVS